MAKQRNALKAGLFIIACIAIVFAIVFAVKGASFESMQTRTVSFSLKDNISGLRVGDEVRIGGFKVGEVRAIEIVSIDDPRLAKQADKPKDHAALLVTFTLPKKYELHEDTFIAIETTVTEKTCLNISKLGLGKEIPPDVTLGGHPSSMYTVIDSLAETGPRINSILRQIDTETVPAVNAVIARADKDAIPSIMRVVERFGASADAATALIKHVHDQISPIVGRYNQVADSARGALNNVADLMGDKSADTDLRGTMKNIRSITGKIDQKLPGILDGIETTVKKVNSSLENFKSIVDNVNDISASAKSIVVGNKGRFDTMMRHLNATAGNLELASQEIRSRPWKLLYTPKKDEMFNLTIFESARDFARGAGELNDAVQALRDATRDKQKSPEEIRKLMAKVEESFKNFSAVEQKLWDAVRK